MDKQPTSGHTGSTLVEAVLVAPTGLALMSVGFIILLTSAMVHAAFSHVLAALVVGISLTGLRVLSRVDHQILATPWHGIIQWTDKLSLALICAATFGPLAIVAVHGHPGWDWAVLGGCLLVWWVVLDALIADHRRIVMALVFFVIAWSPVVVFGATLKTIVFVAEGFSILAVVASVLWLRHSMRGIPAQYRVIDMEPTNAGGKR